MSKEFEGYPPRQIRMSDEVWEKLKKKKLEFGKNWNTFMKSLIEKDNGKLGKKI